VPSATGRDGARTGPRHTDMRFIFPVVRLHSGDAKRKVRTSAAARHAHLPRGVRDGAGEVATGIRGAGALSSAWSADI
jgi:hypothetical protein